MKRRQFPRRTRHPGAGDVRQGEGQRAGLHRRRRSAGAARPRQGLRGRDARRAVPDWQVISYGNTLHGFTNPAADGPIMRAALYNERADRRSWASMRSLFDEVL
jgi:dienelactone hydrolase